MKSTSLLFLFIASSGMAWAASPAEGQAHRPDILSPGSLDFNRYHTVWEFEACLEGMVGAYPSLTRLLKIGESRGGRPILALEINNPETGPAEEKPGFYLDGNIHGGELLAGEGALAFIHRLLTDYGTDARITGLVDRAAFYIVPLVNPDGRAISIDTPENHRWNIRSVDQDRDGAFDEDPPEDLDGDGRILRMRVPDPEGGWTIHPTDSRRMVRIPRGEEVEGQRYALYSEGIDNDGDGRFNEDQVGGVDLNRNFPSNWSPAQNASGPYPLSEPESHALVEYITSRSNIAAVHTFHTSGGLILRFPTLADQEWEFPQRDQEDHNSVAEAGVALTGYLNYALDKQSIVDLMSPGHGVFNDWASNVFGVLAITTEMWRWPLAQGEAARWEWNEEVLGGAGFIDWYPYQHPTLGSLELGGWDRWSTSNPPEHLISGEVQRNVEWVLTFAEKLPRVEILETTVSASSDGQGLFEVRVKVANVGWMATSTVHAQEVLGIAEPVRVSISVGGGELVEGEVETSLGTLPGAREEGPEVRSLIWVVRVPESSTPARVEVVVRSEKAGTVRGRVEVPAG
jgi:hypothetical protein